jgi:hypothetical protein
LRRTGFLGLQRQDGLLGEADDFHRDDRKPRVNRRRIQMVNEKERGKSVNDERNGDAWTERPRLAGRMRRLDLAESGCDHGAVLGTTAS